jgi:uncharacterized protein (DUF302 family)
MTRPFRFWMTGGIAVVTAALGGKSALGEERQATSRSSRWDVAETVQRLEARAHEHGLAVFARMAEPGARFSAATSQGGTVIVFESSSAGGTPVLMASADSKPNLPLSVLVRRNEAGDVEVLLQVQEWDDLPADIARDMTEMPHIVAEALS